MKLIENFTGKLATCITALALVSFVTTVNAQTMKQGSAKVRSVKGTAKYSAEAGGWVPLKVGTTLHSGASIQTGAESIVDLDLGENGPVVRVTPNTTMKLDKLIFSGTGADSVIETKLNVQEGTIIGNVKKLAKASKYEIKTPNGVAGIRGTDYVVTVTKKPDGTYDITFTDVTGTLVVVANVNGQPETVVLNPGESWSPGSDVVPTRKQLLEFYQDQIAEAFRNLPNDNFTPPATGVVKEGHTSPNIGGNPGQQSSNNNNNNNNQGE